MSTIDASCVASPPSPRRKPGVASDSRKHESLNGSSLKTPGFRRGLTRRKKLAPPGLSLMTTPFSLHVSIRALALFTAASLAGCGDTSDPVPNKPGTTTVAPSTSSPTTPSSLTLEQFHKALSSRNPNYTGTGQLELVEGQPFVVRLENANVSDLSPLRGMPLKLLQLTGNPVSDLSPLKGMPLDGLYLDDTQVLDLSPLKDMPLRELDLTRVRATDLSPLKAMPLAALMLEETKVTDLSPLKGMPIRRMSLSKSPVSDLSALSGMPLELLNLLGCPVVDLRPLDGIPLNTLWLSSTPVSDLTPLSRSPLQSLTIFNTRVTDLTPIASLKLKRLHIGQTQIKDLTPLGRMSLERLIFNPNTIEKGLQVIRDMPSIFELGLEFDENTATEKIMRPAEFWRLYDAGAFKR